ncbi:hypothetical protein AB0F72_37020 [Actinoplanes sp. NPDC023936]|uniref:hypothetical protein n=1 Tax=Actinoplanes sp. NPDC023936 TaxID=3154910 RepID=UPI0033E1FF60
MPPSRRLIPALTLVLLAVAAAVAGVLLPLAARGGTPPAATATVDGLTAVPGAAEWALMDGHHMDGQGYQMPSQMMPGAPEGDDMRLRVPMTLTNTGTATRDFDLAGEFSLAGGHAADPVPLRADTFGSLARLGPGSSVTGALYFDLAKPAAADPPMYLIWRHEGREHRLAVNLPGTTTDHSHL